MRLQCAVYNGMHILFLKSDNKGVEDETSKVLSRRSDISFKLIGFDKDDVVRELAVSDRVLITYDPKDTGIIRDVVELVKSKPYLYINRVSSENEDTVNRMVSNLVSKEVVIRVPERKNIVVIPPSFKNDNVDFRDDNSKLLHGLEKHFGNVVGNVPMIFGRGGHNMWFEGMFRNSSVFLVLGGPSLLKVDFKKLYLPGVLSMSVNNAVRTVRTNLWTSVDDPKHFIQSIWLDSKIMKFVPFTHSEKNIFDNEKWEESDFRVGDSPNVWFFKRNEYFRAKQFLIEDSFNWGDHGKLGGCRSVMLVAVRLLYYLGVRKVYLLGCDFKMDSVNKYHFEQDRSGGSISGNNETYLKLIERFEELLPIFNRAGFRIFNCYKESGLKVFPFIDFEDAIREVRLSTEGERTAGLYDRK